MNGNDVAGITGNFSTTLYTGTGSNLKINNGIDLSGDGGLFWAKRRGGTDPHWLVDTARGLNKSLGTSSPNAENTGTGQIVSFDSDGLTLGSSNQGQNYNGLSFVSWTFKKTPKFFDVVTYNGDGNAGKTISHNLGSVPGMMIIKETNGARNWAVYHRSLGATKYLYLNTSDAEATHVSIWNDTAPTSSVFSVGTANNTNRNGGTYIAYLFAHDTTADSMIKCASYAGNGTATNAINLGWTPQFVLLKESSNGAGGGQSWHLFDSARGAGTSGNDPYIRPNSAGDEQGSNIDNIDFTSTGFTLKRSDGAVNGSGDNYIYMAIRAPEVVSTTYDSSIKWSGGTAPTSPAVGETDVITLDTTDGGTTYRAAHAIDGAK